MNEKRINEYIEGKYGAFGVDRYGLSLNYFVLFLVLLFFLHSIIFFCSALEGYYLDYVDLRTAFADYIEHITKLYHRHSKAGPLFLHQSQSY